VRRGRGGQAPPGDTMTETGIGKAVRRKEDRRFLMGDGRYTDDVVLPRQS
jgi:aerobic carbon-monoxide dehydrogenase large subunit